jgi:HEAT repeat protein
VLGWLRFWKWFAARPDRKPARSAPAVGAKFSDATEAPPRPGCAAAGPVQRLAHRDAAVRKAAAEQLGRFGPAARAAVPALAAALMDGVKEVRAAAREALPKVDPSWPNHEQIALALPTLVIGLSHRQTELCEAAAEALGRIGAPAVAALVRALGDAAGDGRGEFRQMWAARALGAVGPAAAPAVAALVRALDSEYAFVREAAAEALGRIGPAAPAVVPALARATGHWHERVRLVAVRALGRLGPAAAGAVPAVIDLLADAQDDVQCAAADALVQIGPGAVQALRHSVEDRADAVRAAKEHALRQTPDQAVPSFFQELERRDGTVRQLAARMLGRIEASTYEVVPPSAGLTVEEKAAHFQLAREEAARDIAAQVMPPLLDGLADRDGVKRRAAATALGRMGPLARAAVPALEKVLNDVNPEVRQAASDALKGILGFGFRGKNA